MMADNKSHLAWVIPGGLGTGRNNIGVPVMESIVHRLSSRYSITVFQLFPVNRDYQPEGFTIVPVLGKNSLVRFIRFFLAFGSHHRRKRFIAVHAFWVIPSGLLAVLVGKMFGVKSIVSVLGGDGVAIPEIGYGRLRSSWGRWLTFLTLASANERTVLSRFLADSLQRAGFNRHPVKVIPWGVDQRVFSFKPRALQGTLRFLHIANFHPVKDQQTLLKAFSILSLHCDAYLTIIGEGVDDERVRAAIAAHQLGERVQILPPVPHHQLAAHYHRADILLHTSRSEGQSEVVTEAMSCGVMVCGTSVGAIYDQPDCSVGVPVGDAEGLAKAVLELIADRPRQERLRAAAREWASTHDLDWTVAQYASLYDSAR